MSKRLKQYLHPCSDQRTSVRAEDAAHPSDQELAELAEGTLAPERREALLRHINACSDCYEAYVEILRFLPEPSAASTRKSPAVRVCLALAASVLLCLAGTIGYFQLQQPAAPFLATVELDSALKTALLELETEQQEAPEGLLELLRQRGIPVDTVREVALAEPYMPAKTLFGPKEYLELRVDKGIVYLKVVRGAPQGVEPATP